MSSKQIWDQGLHTIAGFLFALGIALWLAGICFIFNGFEACPIDNAAKAIIVVVATVCTMVIAWDREMDQHPGQCNSGCMLDLFFWFVGTLLMNTMIYNA